MRKENRTLKRILAKLLVFALVFQMAVPMNLMASPVEQDGFVIDTVSENGITKKIVTDYVGTSTDIVIPDGVTAIAAQAFSGCTAIRTVDLNDVVEIGDMAFYQCQSIESIDLKNVTRIGAGVFSYCLGLNELRFPAVASLSGEAAVLDAPVYVHPDFPITIQIYIPKELENFNLRLLDGAKGVIVEEGHPTYKSVNGALYTKDTDELLWETLYKTEPEVEEKIEGVTLVAQHYTSEGMISLHGWGYTKDTDEVKILCNGNVLETAKTDYKFRWNAEVQLPVTDDTAEGTEFVFVAQMGDYTSEEITVPYYSEELLSSLPIVKSAACHYGSWHEVEIGKGLSDAITFSDDYAPVLQLKYKLERTELINNANCVVNGEKIYSVSNVEGTDEWIVQIPLNQDATDLPQTIELKCELNLDNDATYTYVPLTFDIFWIIDPSGYIYEAVPENRVEGAQMTIYYKASKDADDATEEKWEAEPYYQSNPIMTDANGRYAWDVPEGWWQVVAEKDGYEITKSDWLKVPPPQLDVNLELVSTEKPGVASVELSSDKMKVVFDKYVKTASVADKISLSAAGKDVAISGVTPVNAATREDKETATSFEVATAFELEFESALDASMVYTAAFASGIESYAGTAMDAAEVTDLKVTGIVSGLEIQDIMLLEKGKEYTYNVIVNADQNLAGRKVSVVSSDESVVKVTDSVVTDKDGKASIVVKGYKAGFAQLTFTVDGTKVSKTANAMVLFDSSVMDELQESLEVEIPEGSDIATDEPGEAPKDPTVSENTAPIDLAKATVAAIANQVYTGSALTPDVTVTADGKTLVKDTDYTVSYASNTDAGTAQVTITGKGNYTGTKTATFTIEKAASKLKAEKATYKKAYGAKAFTVKVIGAEGTVTYKSSAAKVAKVDKKGKVTIKNTGRAVITASVAESKNYKAGKVEIVIEVSPKKAAIKTLASKKTKQLTVTWKKDKKATGYEISYSTSKKFKKSQTKKVLVKKNKTTKTTIKKLKKGKTYYVKVRAYKEVKVNGKKVKIYSPYSKVLKKKVK